MGLLLGLPARLTLPLVLSCAIGFACAVADPCAAAERFQATSKHDFADVEHWEEIFDAPDRDAWQHPDAVVAALRLQAGMTVADIGAGTGYFERRLSRAVGSGGAVLAVELEINLLDHIRKRAEREETDNVVPILASFDDPRIPPGSVDRILIVDTYHHIDERLQYFRGLRRALRAGGTVTIVDWKKAELPIGPPPEHKLARDQVVSEMHEAGYRLDSEPAISLPYQYLLTFRAETES